MRLEKLFVPRAAEQDQFLGWVSQESDSEDAKRAALVVGPAGMGKSKLLWKFEELCTAHAPEQWYVQRAFLNANESASPFLERLLIDTHKLFRGKYLHEGPNDARIKQGLLNAVPELGNLLALLVDEDKRPGWARFVDYLRALSETLGRSNGRFVLLIDPDEAMQAGQTADWHSIAKRLPPRIRVVIAQRPDDVIATDTQSKLAFVTIPSSGSLPELSEQGIHKLYDNEFRFGRLKTLASGWPPDVHHSLPPAAFARYGGHPFAHDAVIRILLTDSVDDPIRAIADWPPDLADLLEMLYKSLVSQGEDHRRAALALQIFSMPTPLQVWAKAAGLGDGQLAGLLDDPRYAHFFEQPQPDVFKPFHQLFAERLERELQRLSDMREDLVNAAWKAIEPDLDEKTLATSIPNEFALLAATNVAFRFEDRDRLLKVVDRVGLVKKRIGSLDASEADYQRTLDRYGDTDEVIKATCYTNLGLIYHTRGILDRAEEMFHKALAIEDKLGHQKGMATDYGNLGLVAELRGDIDQAERMYRKSLAIFEKLELPEFIANCCGNLGNIYHRRDDLDQAERMYRKSLEINKKLGRLEWMSRDYGNLGNIFQTRGDLDLAEEMYQKALEIDQQLGRLEGTAIQSGNLGHIYHKRGNPNDARRFWTTARDLFRQVGMPHKVSQVQAWLDKLGDPPTNEA